MSEENKNSIENLEERKSALLRYRTRAQSKSRTIIRNKYPDDYRIFYKSVSLSVYSKRRCMEATTLLVKKYHKEYSELYNYFMRDAYLKKEV